MFFRPEEEKYRENAATWSAIAIIVLTVLSLLNGSGLTWGILGGAICLGAALMNEKLGGKYLARVFVQLLLWGILLWILAAVAFDSWLQSVTGAG